MRVSDFDYELPRELIAQQPPPARDASRLMVLQRTTQTIEHWRFRELPAFLRTGDCLVLNDTRVIPARLIGRRADTGQTVEMLLLEPRTGNAWEVLCKPAKRAPLGANLGFRGEGDDAELTATVVEVLSEGRRVVRLEHAGPLDKVLGRLGHTPLPPYIRRADVEADRTRYQTVYAEHPGAVAAPTAGLHFTPGLLDAIGQRGVTVARITLHVGLGTFRPVKCARVEEHAMHSERCVVTERAARAINAARAGGGRCVAVGTTVVRALESCCGPNGTVRPARGRAELFIHPPYELKVVDALLTNFHLPRSTLLMMVAAFAGREFVLRAYAEAVRAGYRFYSYGDAMLIL
jgi:S-adenosylmethionine:tRNA ribosyltransferase-isomerase